MRRPLAAIADSGLFMPDLRSRFALIVRIRGPDVDDTVSRAGFSNVRQIVFSIVLCVPLPPAWGCVA